MSTTDWIMKMNFQTLLSLFFFVNSQSRYLNAIFIPERESVNRFISCKTSNLAPRHCTIGRRTKLKLHPVIKISFSIFSITRLQTKNSEIKNKRQARNKSRERREQEIKLIKSCEIDWVAVEIGPLKKRHL